MPKESKRYPPMYTFRQKSKVQMIGEVAASQISRAPPIAWPSVHHVYRDFRHEEYQKSWGESSFQRGRSRYGIELVRSGRLEVNGERSDKLPRDTLTEQETPKG